MSDPDQAGDLLNLRSAYRTVFEGSDRKLRTAARKVLGDLFLYAHQGSSVAQPGSSFRSRDLLVVEGRRQAYLRIVTMLRATEEELWQAAVEYKRERADALTLQEDA